VPFQVSSLLYDFDLFAEKKYTVLTGTFHLYIADVMTAFHSQGRDHLHYVQ